MQATRGSLLLRPHLRLWVSFLFVAASDAPECRSTNKTHKKTAVAMRAPVPVLYGRGAQRELAVKPAAGALKAERKAPGDAALTHTRVVAANV